MENFEVKIFESTIKEEAYSKIREELDKNSDFQINDDNIIEFVDCKLILDILKEYKIKYKIIVKDSYRLHKNMPYYYLAVCIYISQKDYVLYKDYFEPENIEFEDEEEYNSENDKITQNINLVSNIFTHLFFIIIIFIFMGLGIDLLNTDYKVAAIVFIIIGILILFFRIIKIIKSFNKK